MTNVFLDYLQFEKRKIYIYNSFLVNRYDFKEFLVYYCTFYITNIWLRGFLTNFTELR